MPSRSESLLHFRSSWWCDANVKLYRTTYVRIKWISCILRTDFCSTSRHLILTHIYTTILVYKRYEKFNEIMQAIYCMYIMPCTYLDMPTIIIILPTRRYFCGCGATCFSHNASLVECSRKGIHRHPKNRDINHVLKLKWENRISASKPSVSITYIIYKCVWPRHSAYQRYLLTSVLPILKYKPVELLIQTIETCVSIQYHFW